MILKLIWSCVFDSVPVKHRWQQEECGKCETETRKSESRWFLKEFFWNLARIMDQYVLCIFLFRIFLHTSYLRKTYIHTSYLRACIPQCKHKRQHLSSGHWRRLQSYRTKDCQRHNGLLKSHISSWSQFSIRISTKLQHQNINQTSASKSWLSLSLKISTKPQQEISIKISIKLQPSLKLNKIAQ